MLSEEEKTKLGDNFVAETISFRYRPGKLRNVRVWIRANPNATRPFIIISKNDIIDRRRTHVACDHF